MFMRAALRGAHKLTLMNQVIRSGVFSSLVVALAACSSSSSSTALPSTSARVSVRFAEGAPVLETIINGVPAPIGQAYLQVNGKSVASTFNYGAITSFVTLNAGTLSLVARDELGYAVGPLKTTALAAGKRYTLVVVGTYPSYSVLAFEEPANDSNAQLALYEASPSVPQTGFGSFRASSGSGFKQLGRAKFGTLATVSLGKRVTDFGGYAGSVSKPLGALKLSQINSFDTKNVLPFHSATRLSLFLFDFKSGSPPNGPLFGVLDQ